MCYTESMTENIVEQQETATAGPEGAVNTSGAQTSGKKAERSYEVMAVIPIELFVPGNRKKVREAINNSEGKNGGEFKQVFPPANMDDPHSRIGQHIKDFSAYEYEIYEIHSNSWSKAVCEIVDDEIKGCKPGEDKSYAGKIKKKLQNDNSKEQYFDTKIIFAMPFASEEKETDKKAEDIADINENTGVVISIQIHVPHVKMGEEESNAAMAKFLKLIGDGLNKAINDYPEKNVAELKGDKKVDGIFKLIVDLLPDDLFKDEDGKGVAKNPLHNEIEINYVFVYFVCKGFDFHILTDTFQVDDNIKYSGDAWFLNKGKIYKDIKNDKYISENYYFEHIKDKSQQSNFVELSENETYYWLTDTLIPEAQIRPKDIYYIPKINGGDRHDYSSVLVKFRNRLCCFIKEKYVNDPDADDQNRIVGMQIVLNSFWHRLIEFSRIMRTMCLSNPKKSQSEDKLDKERVEAKRDKRKSKEYSETHKMYKMDSGVESDFENQIHTTPTLAEQIIDVNSTDQDALTLSDLANYHSISSAKNYFNEQKEIYFRLRADEKQEDREKKANKADQRIQIAVLILALITVPIVIIEIVTADISWWPKGFAISFTGVVILSGIIYFRKQIANLCLYLLKIKNNEPDMRE